MKRDEYLKHLDRAFTETPPGLSATVEEAFRRGEKAVVQRHRIMTALTVAAALAILCAAIALAAGTLLKPRVDHVVAARGTGEGDGSGGASTADRGILKPTHEPEPETSPVAQAAKGEDALQMETPQNLTAEAAIDWVKKLDEKAAYARGFWVYLSSAPNRAWVFYATDYDAREALYKGGAWYLGENSVYLGYSRAVSSWTFCTPDEVQGSEYRGDDDTYDIGGEHVVCGPELFASVIRTGAGSRVHVWKLGEYGNVVELEAGKRLCSIGVSGGALFGLTEEDSGDRCFLREQDGQLCQVCGQPEETSAVEKLPGGKALLDELRGSGFTVTDCLYRSMGADTEEEVVTVNLEWEGKPCHVYLFRGNTVEELDCERGWDDDIDVLSGAGSIVVDAGLPTVTSGGIEATYLGRTREANLAETARGATPAQEESGEFQVYYTSQGHYYHGDALCSGMRNAGAHTLTEAMDDGKARCPVCQPGKPDDIGLFLGTFGCDLEELYPGSRYACTLRDAQTSVCEWMLRDPDDSSGAYGTPVTTENWTIRSGSSLPGHESETVSRMSVWTNAENALTVWRCAPEPLHGMLEEAEALLRDRPEKKAGFETTPLEWLTRTVVTFDGEGEDLLAVTLWFEGPEATTTFRWVLGVDGGYTMALPETVGEG